MAKCSARLLKSLFSWFGGWWSLSRSLGAKDVLDDRSLSLQINKLLGYGPATFDDIRMIFTDIFCPDADRYSSCRWCLNNLEMFARCLFSLRVSRMSRRSFYSFCKFRPFWKEFKREFRRAQFISHARYGDINFEKKCSPFVRLLTLSLSLSLLITH